jgi:hypothetical protein
MRTRAEYNIKDLYEWFDLMFESNPDAHISMKTANFMHLIRTKATRKSYIVFDNAGGMAFSIWEMDEDKIDLFVEQLGIQNYYGKVVKGKAILADHQKKYPHWDIQNLLNRRHFQKIKDEHLNKTAYLKEDHSSFGLEDLKGKPLKIIDITKDMYCRVLVDGKKYKKMLGLGYDIELEVNQALIEN